MNQIFDAIEIRLMSLISNGPSVSVGLVLSFVVTRNSSLIELEIEIEIVNYKICCF